jgi:hypothetical protein
MPQTHATEHLPFSGRTAEERLRIATGENKISDYARLSFAWFPDFTSVLCGASISTQLAVSR